MGRYRSRSRSYSPRRYSRSPPRRKHYDDPRDRPEDLRIPFERFGPVKDVYLPKNYYTGEPRGFGFVKFRYAEDAAVAKQHMNRQIIGGREISIVYAEENRKTPQEMRKMTRISERHMGGRHRRSLSRSPRQRHRSYSHSPTPRHDSRDNGRGGRDYYSPPRSVSPSPLNGRDYGSPDDRDHRSKRSERQSPGPEVNEQSPSRSRSYSPK
ncbi:hypothetical protein ZIOFF_002304 [Zingiber officinale]|uniref:RRM domain-containing protein n=1 Tax=Zingiber officinale TaxID=94328 RepID=A0A8J5IPZ2_ZINOF|nr:hypothetical protein ZIOFF_002304 [Zingiber officinale]